MTLNVIFEVGHKIKLGHEQKRGKAFFPCMILFIELFFGARPINQNATNYAETAIYSYKLYDIITYRVHDTYLNTV